MVTPTLFAKIFEPINRSYTNVTTSHINADFLAADFTGPNTLARLVRPVNTAATPGQNVIIPLEITSRGNEQRISLSLSYDIALLGVPTTAVCGSGAAGCTVSLDRRQPGRVGLIFTRAMPLDAGRREFARITFPTFINTAPSTPISVGDLPIARATTNSRSFL